MSGKYQQNFDLKFQKSSVDVTTEEGYYVLERYYVLIYIYISNLIYIYIYIYIYIKSLKVKLQKYEIVSIVT